TSKGNTLAQLVDLIGFPEGQVLVAGDTLTDLSLYETGYKGVVVGHAEDALYEATGDNRSVYHADATGAGGIIEAIHHYPTFKKYYKDVQGKKKKEKQSGETQL